MINPNATNPSKIRLRLRLTLCQDRRMIVFTEERDASLRAAKAVGVSGRSLLGNNKLGGNGSHVGEFVGVMRRRAIDVHEKSNDRKWCRCGWQHLQRTNTIQ